MQIKDIYAKIKEGCKEKDINIYKTEGYLSATKIVERIGKNDIESLITGMTEASRDSKNAKDSNATLDAMGAFVAYYEAYEKELNR
jgi:hypothetical protein